MNLFSVVWFDFDSKTLLEKTKNNNLFLVAMWIDLLSMNIVDWMNKWLRFAYWFAFSTEPFMWAKWLFLIGRFGCLLADGFLPHYDLARIAYVQFSDKYFSYVIRIFCCQFHLQVPWMVGSSYYSGIRQNQSSRGLTQEHKIDGKFIFFLRKKREPLNIIFNVKFGSIQTKKPHLVTSWYLTLL